MARRRPFKIIPTTSAKLAAFFRVEAEDYKKYFDTTLENIGGIYRNDDVDLEPTTDVGGGFNVGWIAEGEWLTYDLEEALGLPSGEEKDIYLLSIRVASELDTTHSLDISLDGQTTTLSFDGTGGWQSWKDIQKHIIVTPDSDTLRLDMGSSDFNINYIDFNLVALSSSSGLQLIGDDDEDILIGGNDEDVLVGESGDDQLYGGEGNDYLYGESSEASSYLGLGDDSLYGESGNDTLFGGAGNDILDGGAGNDSLESGDGDDLLYGGAGDDSLYAGAGNDTLFGGGYSQEIDVLTGNSTFVIGDPTFVIGDSTGFAYLGGSIKDTEDYSYAIIYPESENYYIQAYGSSSNYELDYNDWDGNSTQDTGIYVGDDLLAVIIDETVDNFDKFIFVSDVFI